MMGEVREADYSSPAATGSFRTTGSQCCTRDWSAPGSST